MKKIIYSLPEVFFVGFSIYWIRDNYTASGSINYFAIAVIATMVFQLIFKKRILGLTSGIVLVIFSLFMLLAVRSEHNDFPKDSVEGLKFLILGEGLFFASALIAGAMIFKFAMHETKSTPMQHSVY